MEAGKLTKKAQRAQDRAALQQRLAAAQTAVMSDPDKDTAFKRGHLRSSFVRGMTVTPYGIAVSFHSLPPKVVLALLDTIDREVNDS